MRAKPKAFVGAGYASDLRFELRREDRDRLARHGFSEEDFQWLDTQMLLYNAAKREAVSEPTTAEIFAALDCGEVAIEAVLDWFGSLDSKTEEHIVSVASVYPERDAWQKLPDALRTVSTLIALTRRSLPEPKAGNRPKSKQKGLARAVVERFSDSTVVYDVLRAAIPGTKDHLRRLIAGARSE